ncbi:MAG: lamin tail domain-containing protein [Candidatus Roizmanbacteria bacterium]|nr:lamin tail domain-containing protein [Candidatus Roizmanbacteria bacterium]
MRAAVLVIALTVFFISALRAYASVRINEIQIEPQEAIELVNDSDLAVDISGWFLDDSGGTTYVTLPDNTLLPAHSCLAFGESFNLNKASADMARLFDNTAPPTTGSAQLIDSLGYTKSLGNSISWQRLPDSTGSAIASASSITLWNYSRQSCLATIIPTEIPTPTALPSPTPQATPTASVTISNIHISEIMANPVDGDEWVELYNDNDYPITITKWYIDDSADAGGSPRSITITIPGYGWGSVTFSGSLLNNSGDTVRLLNATKQEIETVTYGDAPEGASYSRYNGNWCHTTPTQNAPNAPCPAQQTKTTTTTVAQITSNPINMPPVTHTTIQPTIHLTLYRIPPEPTILGASTIQIPPKPLSQPSPFQTLFSLFAALYCCGTAIWFCYTEWYVSQSKKLFPAFLYTFQRES